MSRYRLQAQLGGWLIQAPAPLTAAQVTAARQFALAYGATVETESDLLGPGLIRSETARDLRTLTATGASGLTRRMITRPPAPPWACSARSSARPGR